MVFAGGPPLFQVAIGNLWNGRADMAIRLLGVPAAQGLIGASVIVFPCSPGGEGYGFCLGWVIGILIALVARCCRSIQHRRW